MNDDATLIPAEAVEVLYDQARWLGRNRKRLDLVLRKGIGIRGYIASDPGLVRFRLEEDLYNCGSAMATVLDIESEASGSGSESSGGCLCSGLSDGDSITVDDRIGAVAGSALAVGSGSGDYIPAGMWGIARNWPDSGQYEPLVFGDPQCESGSSGASGSGQSGSQSSESGESKSPCVVRATFFPGGYAELYTAESRHVLFLERLIPRDDRGRERIEWIDQDIPIDPRFVEVCEPQSIEANGHDCDAPALVGLRVINGIVYARFAEQHPGKFLRPVLWITAIRKGFAHVDFGPANKAIFDANNAFWRRSRPKDGG